MAPALAYLGGNVQRPVRDVQVPNHENEERHGSSPEAAKSVVRSGKSNTWSWLTNDFSLERGLEGRAGTYVDGLGYSNGQGTVKCGLLA